VPTAQAESALVLGRYRPLRPLGTGGSGSVWLARDEQDDREVALKVVRREGKAASRAEREVEAAARLRHSRCLRALALDRDDEHVYVAYEYVRGRTFRDALRSGELDDAVAVEAGAQVLEGLAHAHAKGVVHRDVKPANVMLEFGDEVSVRVLDFGLAQMAEADTLTAAGDVPGTLAYVAPERLDGAEASGAADVWAVGVMLWEALTGWHPFSAPSPVETARQIRAGAQPLAESRPDLPEELCELVDAMLDPQPKGRPPAKRLPAALRSALEQRARRPRAASSRWVLRERAVHACLAASFSTATALLLPFFPRGWPFALGAVVGLAALRAPRAGLALALAAPVLPLGNASLGLALAYSIVAAVWFLLFARQPRGAVMFVAGPFAPALTLGVRGAWRRALLAGTGILAWAVAGLLRDSRERLGFGATERPDEAARVVAEGLAARPELVFEAVLFAAAVLAIPLALGRGLWGVAGWGSAFLAVALLAPPLTGLGDVSALLLAPAVCGVTLLLGARVLRPGE
jgi:eukaryotic-like serine/threonine-protein kinase